MSGATTPTPPDFYKTLVGYRQIKTQYRDTLLSIAVRELQDATQWSTIAAINGLTPPYITTDPTQVSATVVLAGSAIFVPAPAPDASAVSNSADVLGIDLVLGAADRSSGDFLGVLTDDGAGDFLTLSGEDNLAQALYNRFGTRPNELIYHLDYGCKVYTLLGKMSGPAAGTLGSSWVQSAATADPRVLSAQGLAATISGDVIAISGSVTPVTGKRLPVGTAQLPGG